MMDESLAKRLNDAITAGGTDVLRQVSDALVVAAGSTLTVRNARDTFSKVVNRAKGGQVQVIGAVPDEMTVVMSVHDLVGFVRKAARPQTLGEALADLGFVPRDDHRLAVRQGRARNRLRTQEAAAGPLRAL